VIFLEYATNCFPHWTCARGHDQLIHYIMEKWSQRLLPPPAFIMIEMFRIDHYQTTHNENIKTVEEKIKSLSIKTVEDINYRLSNGGMFMSAVARFYGIPYISLTDALYPAMTRHFLNNFEVPHTGQPQPFPYYYEVGHINARGHYFLAESLILPLLLSELNREIKPGSRLCKHMYLFDHDIRIFPADAYKTKVVVGLWKSWGSAINTLSQISSSHPQWQYESIRGHKEHGLHVCLESSVAGATVDFALNFTAGSCAKGCNIAVTTLGSWNTSYVGHTACQLLELTPTGDTLLMGAELLIDGNTDGNGLTLKATTVHSHEIDSQSFLKTGEHILRCRNIDENKVSCIAIKVYYEN
jgi:hypothetical protein